MYYVYYFRKPIDPRVFEKTIVHFTENEEQAQRFVFENPFVNGNHIYYKKIQGFI